MNLHALSIDTKIDDRHQSPYYQQRKCSAETQTLVCEDIRVMPIFAGVRWIGGIKLEWCRRKLPFWLLAVAVSFEISYRPKLLSEYVVPNGLSLKSCQRHRNTTLNSHFALNTVFRVESFTVDALVLKLDCFYRPTVSGTDVAHGLWFLETKFMPIFVGICW